MIELDIHDGAALCTLNAPPVNTINPEWCASFNNVLDELEASRNWQVLHIRSALRLFCAGADLRHVASSFDKATGLETFLSELETYRALFSRIERLQGVTFAEIGGAALGGGLELALACDLRLVADEIAIGLPEVGLGLLPAIGGTQRLTTVCGAAVAKRLILNAETVRGSEAVALGIAQWSVAHADIATRATSIVEKLAGMPRLALQYAKACISQAGSVAGSEGELTGSRDLFMSAETRTRVAKFLDRKRQS